MAKITDLKCVSLVFTTILVWLIIHSVFSSSSERHSSKGDRFRKVVEQAWQAAHETSSGLPPPAWPSSAAITANILPSKDRQSGVIGLADKLTRSTQRLLSDDDLLDHDQPGHNRSRANLKTGHSGRSICTNVTPKTVSSQISVALLNEDFLNADRVNIGQLQRSEEEFIEDLLLEQVIDLEESFVRKSFATSTQFSI